MKRILHAVLGAALCGAACKDADANAPPANPAGGGDPAPAVSRPKDPVLVRVAAVALAPIERTLEATAHVESLDVVDVVAERAEPVREVLVEEGAVVQAGAVLARLRDEQAKLAVAEARVRLQGAREQWEKAQRDHQRNLALAADAQGPALLSERELDASAERLLNAQNLVDAAQVAMDQAQWELGRCTISAPISGTIAERWVSTGDTTAIGARLFQIVDLAHPKAVFHRPQRELASLRVGQEVSATSEALPGVVVPGRIERISPIVDPVSGTVKVTAALQSGAATLPAGVLVRLQLLLDRKEQALLVPKRALLYEGQRVVCFAVREDPEDGTPRARRIELTAGYEDPQYLEALPAAGGLAAGDRVVIVGADRLADGDRVQLAAE